MYLVKCQLFFNEAKSVYMKVVEIVESHARQVRCKSPVLELLRLVCKRMHRTATGTNEGS